MTTFKHSGTAGDTIYSLAVVKHMGGGDFKVGIGLLDLILQAYGYKSADIATEHTGRYTDADYDLIAPLIARQPYINSVSKWHSGDPSLDYDLDRFRGVLYRTFEGNILEAYFKTLDLPIPDTLHTDTWLEADPQRIAPIVVTLSPRYRNGQSTDDNFKRLAVDAQLDKNGVFLGTPKEHADFVTLTGVNIPYHPVKDFLEMANIIAGADLFLGNQGLSYSIAVGLGKDCVLDIHKVKPEALRECFFKRNNIQYI
jgi:hypothetical protein